MASATYVSTEFSGLKIIREARTKYRHEITKHIQTTKGKHYQFVDGKLILTDKDDILWLDTILSGEVEGVKPPTGVKKITEKAIKMHNFIKDQQPNNPDVKILEDMDAKAKAKGRQGAAG